MFIYYEKRRQRVRVSLIVVVSLQNVGKMFVVPEFLELLLLGVGLLPLYRGRLLGPVVLHRPEALLLQVLVDLLVVHRVDGDGSPEFLELVVDGELGRFVVVEYDLLLVHGPRYEEYLVMQTLRRQS